MYICIFPLFLQSQDQKYLNGLILEEKQIEKDKKEEIQFAEKQAKNQKKLHKEALIDELVSLYYQSCLLLNPPMERGERETQVWF